MFGRRGAVAVAGSVAVLSVLLSTAAPAMAAPGKDRLAIGDSVMLGAANELRDRGFRVDATESRQAYKGPSVVRSRAGSLPTNVVVHLGTNGTFPLSTCRAIVKAVGPERRVFLVNVAVPRSWERGNNAAIRRCAESFASDRVQVIDWHAQAAANRQWLYSDRIHLKPSGQRAFARLIDQSVDDAEERARTAALMSASGTGRAGLLT